MLAFLSLAIYIAMNNIPDMNLNEAPPSFPPSSVTHPQLPDIDVKAKAAPKKKYVITFAFNDLPGHIENVSLTADYAVANLECVPPQPVSGARLRPEYSLALDLQKVDAHRYAAVLYSDALQNEDYFGLGECLWALNWASLRFDSPNTRFVGGMPVEQIESAGRSVLHYLASDYRDKPDPEVVVFGEEDDIFTPEAGPRFSLTITASEDAQ
jgi:hypothetical protein